MIAYTIYNNIGQILRTGYCTEADYEIQTRPGEFITVGIWADNKYYYDGSNFIEMPNKPGKYYYFDYVTVSWKLNEALALANGKNQRNSLLINSDWTQMPDVTIPNKAEWATYRQTLRDMTDEQLIAGQFPASP
jgi:hypothetical protein